MPTISEASRPGAPINPVEEMLIQRDCERLVIEYARRIDARSESFVDIFTADAKVALLGYDMQGHDELAKFANSYRPDDLTLHLCGNIAIEVIDGDEAHGSANLLFFCAPGAQKGKPLPLVSPWVIGAYRDVFRRTPEGWRIASRAFAATFVADLQAPPAP